ncbi:MAG: S49 family peptidase [Thiohalomonadales bacterium]|nr:S49 family peptidase [Thiohalomonadales bacterium]
MFGNTPSNPNDDNPKWQEDIVNRLAFAALNEQRRSRRWNIFFKTLFLAYLFLVFFALYLPEEPGKGISVGKHTAVVELSGMIADNTEANADNIVAGLRAAFEDKNTAGVILRINSPGGSPVQAGYVYDEIIRLREKYPEIKLYAVITDMAASGGYYVAAAADEIYADKASVVGSIGVLMNGFGFTGAMEKLGIERRLYTAGKHKGMLDPFSKENPADVAHIKKMLNNIHQQFIDAVKQGRGDRLVDDPNIFSGMFWTGEEGVELGLVDGLGSSSYVAREIIQQEKMIDFTPRPDYWQRFADRIGLAMARVLGENLGINSATLR